MKKILRALAGFWFLLSATAPAVAAEEMYLSYCEGMIADDTNGGTITGKIGAGSIDLAIRIPAADLSGMNGMKITKIRAGLPAASKMPTHLVGWIRYAKEDDNIAVSDTTPCAAGWTVLTLQEPFVITDTTDLYIGFTYYQSAKYNVISLAGPTDPDGSWVGKNKMWISFADKNYGSLAIEGIIEGDNLPQHNLALTSAYLSASKVHIGDDIVVKGTVKNLALRTADSLVFDYKVGGHTGSVTLPIAVAYREEKAFSFHIPTAAYSDEGSLTLALTLRWPNGEADEDTSNNAASFPIALFSNAFTKKVVLEEFTTENCGYCPPAVGYLTQAIATCMSPDNVIWICHHAGYGTDWLTIAASSSYVWLYNPSYIYAPAQMVNRTHHDGYSDTGSPVTGIATNPKYDADLLNLELDDISLVQVEVEATLADDVITITVEGEKYAAFDAICPSPHLFVMVKEDNIKARAQANATNFVHENVLRAVATATWGDAITWTDGRFSATYTVALNADWKAEDLSVVAFVGASSTTDRLGNTIYNADVCDLTIQSSALGRVTTSVAPVRTEYYSIDGTPLPAAAPHGISLRRDTYPDGTVRVAKTTR